MRARSLFLIALLCGCGASTPRAQVQSNPNQIRGTFRFSNTNPAARAILDLFPVVEGEASATHPTLGTASTTVTPGPAASCTFELSVQATPEGASHEVVVQNELHPSWGFDRWTTSAVMSPAVYPEPSADVDLLIEECAALIRLKAYDQAGARIPWSQGGATAQDGSRSHRAHIGSGLMEDYLVLPVQPLTWRVIVSVSGYEQQETTVGPIGCDEIVDVDVTLVPRPPPMDPGECIVTGLFDIVGETERVRSNSGRARTHLDTQGGHFEYTEAPAEGPFEMTGVDAGRRFVTVSTTLRAFNQYQELEFEGGGFDCPAGSTTDIGTMLVINPGVIAGDIFLAGPPPIGAAEPALAHVERASSGPNGADFYHPSWLRVDAGLSRTDGLFDGDFQARSAAFEGSLELVVGVTSGRTLYFNVPELRLSVNREPPSGPLLDQHLFALPAGDLVMTPGATVERSLRYCMSEVAFGFESLAGEFEAARISALGSLQGLDFEGNVVDYRANVGTSPDESLPLATTATVHALLPEGEYVVIPRVAIPNPGGGTTETRLMEFPLTVGCRENLRVFDTLQLHVTPAPPSCADGPVSVRGAVSGGADVASIAWRVNGGADTIVCAPCGVDPSFDVMVPTVSGDNEITVEAIDGTGRRAHAIVTTRRATEPATGQLEPLHVTRDALGDVQLTWGGAPIDFHAVHRGTITSLRSARTYDHARVSPCDLSLPEFTDDASGPDHYYLVTAGCGLGHGSYGRDSLGVERPRSANDCP